MGLIEEKHPYVARSIDQQLCFTFSVNLNIKKTLDLDFFRLPQTFPQCSLSSTILYPSVSLPLLKHSPFCLHSLQYCQCGNGAVSHANLFTISLVARLYFNWKRQKYPSGTMANILCFPSQKKAIQVAKHFALDKQCDRLLFQFARQWILVFFEQMYHIRTVIHKGQLQFQQSMNLVSAEYQTPA